MAAEQEVQPSVPAAEEVYEENVQQEADQEYAGSEETTEHPQEARKRKKRDDRAGDRGGFVHGLSVGLGIGCIATFVITWISLFFTPQMPASITYESLLSVFIYPLIYLLAVGLIALTAGVVREYYTIRR
jgi:threonine/homoserine/homoserine lactone efflux protein